MTEEAMRAGSKGMHSTMTRMDYLSRVGERWTFVDDLALLHNLVNHMTLYDAAIALERKEGELRKRLWTLGVHSMRDRLALFDAYEALWERRREKGSGIDV